MTVSDSLFLAVFAHICISVYSLCFHCFLGAAFMNYYYFLLRQVVLLFQQLFFREPTWELTSFERAKLEVIHTTFYGLFIVPAVWHTTLLSRLSKVGATLIRVKRAECLHAFFFFLPNALISLCLSVHIHIAKRKVDRAQAAAASSQGRRRSRRRKNRMQNQSQPSATNGIPHQPRITVRESYRPSLLAVPVGGGAPYVIASAAERNDPKMAPPGARSAALAATALQTTTASSSTGTPGDRVSGASTAPSQANSGGSGYQSSVGFVTGAAATDGVDNAQPFAKPKGKRQRRRRARVPDPESVSAKAAAFLRPQVSF